MAKNLILLSLSVLASAVPLEKVLHKRAPKLALPANDQWYAAPADIDLASKKPGDILRWRDVPAPISFDNTTPIRPKAAIQIQYRTTNSVGDPIANVVTVLVPYGARPKNLFAYSFFSDAANPNCNPSIAIQTGISQDAVYTKTQLAPAIVALNAGFYVSIADDGGPQASFPAGLTAAYTTLDSIRALKLSGEITGLDPDPIITLNGYSGGGITAAWTAEMEAEYAPELNIAGIALGGLIPDFKYLADGIIQTGGLHTWAPPVFVGLSHDYKNMSDWLDANLDPALAGDFWKTETFCIDGNSGFYADKDISKYFTRGYAAWADDVPQSVLRSAGIMGLRGTPKAPLYLYETVGDQSSPINLTTALYEKYCEQGASIYYEQNQIPLSHADESLAGFPGAFSWMRGIHNGFPTMPGCRTAPVTINTAMFGPAILVTSVWNFFLAILGVPIGRLSDFPE